MRAYTRVLGSLIAVLLLAALSPANAATIQLRAWLNGAQVPLAVGGTGLATVTFDTATKAVTWNVSYTGLTGECTAAHFHGPAAAGINAGPTPNGTIPCSDSPLVGNATFTPAEETQLLTGQLYINIHTLANGGGEIRGQVVKVRQDFDGDGRSDVLWRNFATGENYLYPMNGTAILGSEGYLRTVADQNWFVAGIGDFDADGKADVLWRNGSTGENYIYLMDGTTIAGEGYLRTVSNDWEVAVVADFNGDGKADILWRNKSTGENYIYPMDGITILGGEGYIRTVADQNWFVTGVGDFNGDGKADILWRNEFSGENYIYPMDGTTILGAEGYIRTVADQSWEVAGVADFDGDGRSDVLWRNSSTGENYMYPMAGLTILPAEGYLRTVADQNWFVVAVGDFDGDGRSDIFWRNAATGENYVYPMNGTAILGTEGYVRTVADQNWQVMGLFDYEDGDGDGGGGPTLNLSFNFPHGTFGGATTGLLDFPAPLTGYFALFNSGNDPTPPASVFFTGPEGSGLSNTESVASFSNDNNTGYSSPELSEVPPGGEWIVSYEGSPIAFNLADPDSPNRGILAVPTVTLDGDNLTAVQWQYKDATGATVSPPQTFVDHIELTVDGLVGEQVVRLYDSGNLPFATTSHNLTSPVSWSAVTMIQMRIHDDRGNVYTSFWTSALPPAPSISGFDPVSGPVDTPVTITGVNFGCHGCVGGVNAVRFAGAGGSGADGVAAVFTVDSATQLTATVPEGVVTGPVWVQSIGGTATSGQDFTAQ